MQGLSKEAKERYMDKIQKIGCSIDPYLDSYTNKISLLPSVKYAHIYDFIGNHTINGSDPKKPLKVLMVTRWLFQMDG